MTQKTIYRLINPTTLATILGLQFLRLLFPGFVFYLRDTLGWASLSLAPIALGVFGATILVIPLERSFGRKRLARLLLTLTAVFRVAEYLSRSSPLDLALSVGGVILFGMWISLAVQFAQDEGGESIKAFGYQFLLGIALDTAILTAGLSLDLSWQNSIYSAVIIIFLSLALLFAWGRSQSKPDFSASQPGKSGSAWPLIALGPYLLLQLLIIQNIGLVGSLTGWSLPAAGLWIWFTNLGALLVLVWTDRFPFRKDLGVLLSGTGLILVLLVIYRSEGWPAAFLLLAVSLLAAFLWGISIYALAPKPAGPAGRNWIPWMNTLGLLLFVIFSFLYYVSYDLHLGFRGPSLLPVIAGLVVLLALAAARLAGVSRSDRIDWTLFSPMVLLAVSPLLLGLTWKPVGFVDPWPEARVIRVMTYNLHQGFNTSGALDIEALAAVIESTGADVVALQEVTRSYVTNGSLDMLPWLSQRLDLPYFWGPTDPPQWGNALLSRFPIVQAENLPLPPDSLSLRRGYIDATLFVGPGTVRVMATHLHHLEPDSEIRQGQVKALLSAWAGSPHTVLLGDLNAVPDDPEMQLLAAAGFVETVSSLGQPAPFTFYSADPDRQLDYIWLTPDLQPLAILIPHSLASDHLPVVVEIQLP